MTDIAKTSTLTGSKNDKTPKIVFRLFLRTITDIAKELSKNNKQTRENESMLSCLNHSSIVFYACILYMIT